jgi:aldehyde dehydrogenase (NAD+)
LPTTRRLALPASCSPPIPREPARSPTASAPGVYLNGAPFDRSLPFGGYKQSGNGREFGVFGFEEYLEVKAIIG